MRLRSHCATGMQIGPFTWSDLAEWQRFCGVALYPFELRMLEYLDGAMLNAKHKKG